MNTVVIKKISIDEKEEMLKIYNKRASLDELIFILSKDSSTELYKKVSNELTNTIIEYDKWWEKIGRKYNWKISENEYFILDFNTCEVIVKEKSTDCKSY